MSTFKKYLSYLFPIKLESKIAQDNVPLKVYYDNGKIKLFTKTTNYSGGKLKTMFKKALRNVEFTTNDHVLILGFGMGSIWEIIKQDKAQNPHIDGVDYEPLMAEFIQAYNPGVIKDRKTTLIINDALSYLQNCKQNYAYILIDLFLEEEVAPIIINPNFINQLYKVCNTDTIVVINTMHVKEEEMEPYFHYFRVIHCIVIEKTNKVYYLSVVD